MSIELVENGPRGIDLAKALDSFVTRQKFNLRNEGDGWWHPSEAAVEIVNAYGEAEVLGTCGRKAYLRAVGGFERVSEPDVYVTWTTYHGSQIEKMITELCEQMGIWVANSVPFHNREHNVKGEIDLVIQEPGFDRPSGAEVKSFYSYEATKQIIGSKRPPTRGRPKDNHLLQAATYLYFFRDKLARMKLFYFARDSSKHREFNLTLHDDEHGITHLAIDDVIEKRFTINDILQRFQYLSHCVAEKNPPPKDFVLVWDVAKVELERARGNISDTKYNNWKKGRQTIGDWNCGYCSYKQVCWPADGGASNEEESE